jgi:hypothetical protein
MRHSSGSRNRRKIRHHAECLRDELEKINRDLLRLQDKVRYALGRTYRMLDRLTTE